MKHRLQLHSRKQSKSFDKYDLYVNSVQSADHDAELIFKMFKQSIAGNSQSDILLREDFCGTAALCYEWAALSPKHHAMGIDLDSQALQWGKRNLAPQHAPTSNNRVKLVCGDVMRNWRDKPNIICALNFSYFFLKTRPGLLRYLKSCRKSLKKNGLLVLDAFGGPEYLGPHLDRRRNSSKRFTFWWEVENFDAISNQIKTHIHFKIDGEKIRKRVFSYDWRLWSIPEITELLLEAGFKKIEYWAEGLTWRGEGNGRFRKITSEKNCETWITYITAQ